MEFCGFLNLLDSLKTWLGLLLHPSYCSLWFPREEKNGKTVKKAAKSCYQIAITSVKSNFFLSRVFLHGTF